MRHPKSHRTHLRHRTAIADVGAATAAQTADRPVGPWGWVAMAGLAAAGTWCAATALNGAALTAAQADAQQARQATAAAQIERDRAAAALAINQAQIRTLCTATGMGGSNGK